MNSIKWTTQSPDDIRPAEWVTNPQTGMRERILDTWRSEDKIPCPRCGIKANHKLIVTEEHVILYCDNESKFLWTMRR